MSLSSCASLPTLVLAINLTPFLLHHFFFFFLINFLLQWTTFVTTPCKLLASKDLQVVPQIDQKKRGEPLDLEISCRENAVAEYAGEPAEGEI